MMSNVASGGASHTNVAPIASPTATATAVARRRVNASAIAAIAATVPTSRDVDPTARPATNAGAISSCLAGRCHAYRAAIASQTAPHVP